MLIAQGECTGAVCYNTLDAHAAQTKLTEHGEVAWICETALQQLPRPMYLDNMNDTLTPLVFVGGTQCDFFGKLAPCPGAQHLRD